MDRTASADWAHLSSEETGSPQPSVPPDRPANSLHAVLVFQEAVFYASEKSKSAQGRETYAPMDIGVCSFGDEHGECR